MKYRFVERLQSRYGVRPLCAALGIARSGYYAWRKRQPTPRAQGNQVLLGHIQRIHTSSRLRYGSPRVYLQLRAAGWAVGRGRVARLMRLAGLRGLRRYRTVQTTHSKHHLPLAPNVLGRDFCASAPNQKWVADITYIRTDEGWLYLAVVMDLFSRRIVGWAMADRLRTELVEQALRMALHQRQPPAGLLHHSDQGSQYAAHAVRRLLAAHHIQLSMSRSGNCYDNAAMESFFSTLKCEWVYFQHYTSRPQARRDLLSYIEGFYNRERIHSALGAFSPVKFEAQWHPSP